MRTVTSLPSVATAASGVVSKSASLLACHEKVGGVVCYVVVWLCVVWCGMAWRGVAWRGVALRGVV